MTPEAGDPYRARHERMGACGKSLQQFEHRLFLVGQPFGETLERCSRRQLLGRNAIPVKRPSDDAPIAPRNRTPFRMVSIAYMCSCFKGLSIDQKTSAHHASQRIAGLRSISPRQQSCKRLINCRPGVVDSKQLACCLASLWQGREA